MLLVNLGRLEARSRSRWRSIDRSQRGCGGFDSLPSLRGGVMEVIEKEFEIGSGEESSNVTR